MKKNFAFKCDYSHDLGLRGCWGSSKKSRLEKEKGHIIEPFKFCQFKGGSKIICARSNITPL